ncbi:MAG: DUF3006 domain-containing protein [Acidobacteriota bacterium]|nr:DUF3006 domain-containing protein [Acidobacteriota bacterium]
MSKEKKMPEEISKRAPSSKTRGVIDRIEDNEMAVVLVGDDEAMSIDVPLSLLPKGAGDGDHLTITFTLNKESRAEAEDRVKAIQERLTKKSSAADKKEIKL